MDIRNWILFDTFIILLNLFFVFYKLRSFKGKTSFFARISVFFLLLLFIFPSGLVPVGVLSIVELTDIPRNWYLHLKIGPLGIADIVTLIFSGICVFHVSHNGKVNRFILMSLNFIFLTFFLGIISAIFLAINVDYQNLLNVSRTFLLIVLFMYAGYVVVKKFGQHGIEILSSCLWGTFIMSMVSMVLLDPAARAIRYFVPAMLQSQQFVSVIPFLALYFYVKRKESPTCRLHSRLWCIATVMMFFMGYKAFYFLLLLFIGLYVISKLRIMSKTTSAILFMLFLLIFQPVLLYLNFILGGFSAVDTRAFQVINSMATLENRGLMSILFGIGWGQWYTVYFEFPTIDYGAWGANQLASDDAKYSIQIAPFSLIRSIGIVGFSAVLAAAIIYIRKLGSIRIAKGDDKFLLCGMVAVNVSTVFTLPDVLLETAAFAAFFCAAMIAIKGQHEAA